MTGKAKSRRRYSAPSSGKVIFVLGAGTVLILLIVGWVLVHGGLSEIPLPGKEALRGLFTGEAGQKTSPDELQATVDRLEKRIREMEETHRNEIKVLRDRYEQQLQELKLEIRLLQDENKRLQSPSRN
jgi:hypothetical protein